VLLPLKAEPSPSLRQTFVARLPASSVPRSQIRCLIISNTQLLRTVLKEYIAAVDMRAVEEIATQQLHNLTKEDVNKHRYDFVIVDCISYSEFAANKDKLIELFSSIQVILLTQVMEKKKISAVLQDYKNFMYLLAIVTYAERLDTC
jgi:hypothetical protein